MGKQQIINRLLIAFFALTGLFISCKKEPRGATDNTNTSIYGKWGLTTEFEEMYFNNQLVESNTFNYNPEDETLEFRSDGKAYFYEKDELSQTYDFSFSNNQIIIYDDEDPSYNDTMQVKLVTNEELVLVQEWDEPTVGELFRTTLTFIRK